MKKISIFFLKLKKIIQEKRINDLLAVLGFILGIILIFFYFQLNQSSKPKYGGIYREALYEPINNLNPLSPQNDSEKAILNIIYPPLIEFDNGKIISKYLKNFYFSPDYLTLTIELKDNLFWSDGNKITTDDLKFSFETFKKNGEPEIVNFFKNVDLKIIDNQKAEFQLALNNNYFLYRLNYLKILPAKIFASSLFEEKFNLENLKIGAGPFVFDSLKKDNKITILTLKRNDYYKPKPYLEKISFYVYPSTKRAFESLILKEVDGLAGVNYFRLPNNISFNYQIYKITLPRVIGIFFNSQKIETSYIKFLDQKINRRDLINNVFNGFAEESQGLFSPTLRKVFQISELPINNQGFSSTSSEVTILVPSSYFYPDIARYLREKLFINFSFIEPTDIFETIKNKNFQGILYGIEYSHPPEISSFFSNVGYNINNIENLNLEKKLQLLINDPQIKINNSLSEIEKEIVNLNKNVFLLNPYYIYLLNEKIIGFDQFYLPKPEARFVKIEFWHKSK